MNATLLGVKVNEIVRQFQGLIIYITVNEKGNKIIAHMNHSIKSYKNYEDSVRRALSTAAKDAGYSNYRICTEQEIIMKMKNIKEQMKGLNNRIQALESEKEKILKDLKFVIDRYLDLAIETKSYDDEEIVHPYLTKYFKKENNNG